ncbi:hypothetical protein [Kaistella antarctica]|uniref:Uncharacterized protein n=1 Tax=Kaistella antarctica TaxID=266748 RepID=A0ABR4TVA6_9FLAO|nr:hypothetical protein [Kaistella antarctica]KEY17907.1 hypothetical protein HY04_05060 [Kaistella antarctica]
MNFKETEFRPNFLCAQGLNSVSIIDSENSAKYSESVDLDKIINDVYLVTFQATSTLFLTRNCAGIKYQTKLCEPTL